MRDTPQASPQGGTPAPNVSGVPPLSSLIFVVILAVWAVYLIQHWVRRRDHLATARSVDRFSESMRVLERRRALPKPDLAERAPRSYSVSPLRPARPQVVIKRRASRTATPVTATAGLQRAGATVVAPSRQFRRARFTARLRAAGLLSGSLTMVTLVGLSLARLVPSWAALVGILVLGAAVGAVRWSASAERARRRTAHAKTSRSLRPAARPAAPVEVPAPAHAFARQSLAATTRTARRAVIAPQLYDLAEVEASLTDVVMPAEPEVLPPPGAAVASEAAVGTWQPVPVPPPTYTLKAKAYRADLTGGAQLPADGTEMALEEEFEDLPRVERVG